MPIENYSFLHAADLHIDSPLRGLERYEEAPVEAIRGATRRAFENLVAKAIELEVAFVVLAGDIFDGDWKDHGTGLWFAQRLRELSQAGISVYLAAGNHDAQGKTAAALVYPEGVYRFSKTKPQTFRDPATGTALHGQSFATAAITENLAASYPKAIAGALNIGVLHTALTGREGHDPYAPCSPDELRSHGYDYWALGHVHQREIVAEDPWIVFPGNLQARHIRETGAKGATLVGVADGRIRSVEHLSFDVLRFVRLKVDVEGCGSRAACLDQVAAALSLAREEAEDRLLAARVTLVGRTEASDELYREHDDFLLSCRDWANGVGDIWIEKLEQRTHAPSSANEADMIEVLDLNSPDLRAEVLSSLQKDLENLRTKMPPGLGVSAGLADLADPEVLERILDEARDEVIRRLLDADRKPSL